MSKAYAGVIFDIDDTLYPVSQLLSLQWAANSERLKDKGIDARRLSKAYAELDEDLKYSELIPQALRDIGSDPHWMHFLRDIAEENVPFGLSAHSGVANLFASLKRHGIKIGVLSNGRRVRQLQKIEALDLLQYCDSFIVCDGIDVEFKPHTAPFLQAAQELELSPYEICMVGDRSDNDIAPALELGMGGVRLEMGNHRAQGSPVGVTLNTKVPQTAWAWLLDNVSSQRAIRIPEQRAHSVIKQVPASV